MLWTSILLAVREIRANTLRSILTALGIIIGVAAVIVMVTLGGGASARVQQDIQGLGQNLLVVVPSAGRAAGPPVGAKLFDAGDEAAILRDVPGIRAIAPSLGRAVTAVFGTENESTSVTGTDNAFFDVRDWALSLGRPFTDGEVQGGKAVCVLGETVRRELFGAQDPVGERIRLDNVSCQVIGVLESKGQSTFGQDQDNLVLAPIRMVQRRLAGTRDIGFFWVGTIAADDATRVKEGIAAVLRERRNVAEGAQDSFDIRDLREITQVVESTTAILTAFLGAIAAVSLVVGGIGIMNIMLVSVTERTREIGIRLAIGARERDVLLQFLIEATLMSAMGGLIGIVLGLGGSALLAPLLGIPFVPDYTITAIAVVFSGLVGIAFGFFPARRAARLDPIEALRFE